MALQNIKNDRLTIYMYIHVCTCIYMYMYIYWKMWKCTCTCISDYNKHAWLSHMTNTWQTHDIIWTYLLNTVTWQTHDILSLEMSTLYSVTRMKESLIIAKPEQVRFDCYRNINMLSTIQWCFS